MERPYIRNSALNCEQDHGQPLASSNAFSRRLVLLLCWKEFTGSKKAENDSATSVSAGLKNSAWTGIAASSKDTANGTDINTKATPKSPSLNARKLSPKKPPTVRCRPPKKPQRENSHHGLDQAPEKNVRHKIQRVFPYRSAGNAGHPGKQYHSATISGNQSPPQNNPTVLNTDIASKVPAMVATILSLRQFTVHH